VTVQADQRPTIVIPRDFLIAGASVDMVRLASGALAPVQRGRAVPMAQGEGIEILSGLVAGDALVRP
jgi:hypothetical protein